MPQLFLHPNFGNWYLNFDVASKPFTLDLTGHWVFLFVCFFISGVSIIYLHRGAWMVPWFMCSPGFSVPSSSLTLLLIWDSIGSLLSLICPRFQRNQRMTAVCSRCESRVDPEKGLRWRCRLTVLFWSMILLPNTNSWLSPLYVTTAWYVQQ